MSNYQAKIEAYLTHYQPELKAELVQSGELQTYLQEQAEVMGKMKVRTIEQLREKTPTLSQLQADMEAERIVLETYLTP